MSDALLAVGAVLAAGNVLFFAALAWMCLQATRTDEEDQ